MSKRKIILAGLGFLVAIGVIWGIRVIGGDKLEELIEPGGESVKTVQTEEILYEDAAGFSFKLLGNLVVEDKTEEAGEEYYTALEITKDQGLGKRGDQGDQPRTTSGAGFGNQGDLIRVAIRDTKYKTVEEWFNEDLEAPKDAKLAGAVALDEIPAKQYTKDKKIWTVAVDLGALYLIEGTQDKGYWEDTYNRLIETFAFAQPEPAQKTAGSSSSGSSVGGNVIYEAEEVIE